jgi:hypothetical protein
MDTISSRSVDKVDVTRWLLSGERGLSSEFMVGHLTAREFRTHSRHSEYPLDMDDFRRCEVALREIAGLREHLPRMAGVSGEWKRLVENWDEIVRLAEVDNSAWFRRYWDWERRVSLWGTPPHNLLRSSIGRDS